MVLVNTYEPTKRLTIDMESTAYHEGVPGHHLQIAIQQELGDLPPFRQQSGYVAFQEGWALYSERLGKEVGFYQDPYNDYGRLQDEMLRAIRLVVDTGLHAKHWTRAQVVKFFHDHSTIDEPSVQAETDRYIAIPGQALGYKIGQLTISAAARQGARTRSAPRSTSARSTTRCSAPARCRSTCSSAASTPGSRGATPRRPRRTDAATSGSRAVIASGPGRSIVSRCLRM